MNNLKFFNDFLIDCSLMIPGLDSTYVESFKYFPLHTSMKMYGAPKWDFEGARTPIQSEAYTIKMIDMYKDKGIPVVIIANRPVVNSGEFLKLNPILDKLDTCCNSGIVLGNDELNDYVKTRYPNIKTYCSIVKSSKELGINRDIDFRYKRYQDYYSKYDFVMLHPDDNFNDDLIDSLDKSRMEILLNDYCVLFCENRSKHYDNIVHNVIENCAKSRFSNSTLVSVDRFKTLADKGVKNFKFNGRGYGEFSQIIFNLEYYLIKSEYQLYVQNTIIENKYNNRSFLKDNLLFKE